MPTLSGSATHERPGRTSTVCSSTVFRDGGIVLPVCPFDQCVDDGSDGGHGKQDAHRHTGTDKFIRGRVPHTRHD